MRSANIRWNRSANSGAILWKLIVCWFCYCRLAIWTRSTSGVNRLKLWFWRTSTPSFRRRRVTYSWRSARAEKSKVRAVVPLCRASCWAGSQTTTPSLTLLHPSHLFGYTNSCSQTCNDLHSGDIKYFYMYVHVRITCILSGQHHQLRQTTRTSRACFRVRGVAGWRYSDAQASTHGAWVSGETPPAPQVQHTAW